MMLSLFNKRRYMKITAMLVGLLGFLTLTTSAEALTIYNPIDKSIEITGAITADEYTYFKNIIENNVVEKVVAKDSPGGNFVASANIGLEIIDRGLDTETSGDCMSGCAYIWLAGKTKTYMSTSRIGIHMPGVPRSDFKNFSSAKAIMEAEVQWGGIAMWYFGRIGLSSDLARRFSETPLQKMLMLSTKMLTEAGVEGLVIADAGTNNLIPPDMLKSDLLKLDEPEEEPKEE